MTEKKDVKGGSYLAVVRIRGDVNTEKKVRNTLSILRLNRVNHCIILPKKPEFEGMLKKAQRSITWGEVSSDMLEKIVYKRGRFAGDKRVDKKDVKSIAKKMLDNQSVDIKPVFRMSPPSKGFKGTRLPYPKGDLGYRGEKINELLKRMI
ncbi:MAG: 50S ribosomal protein L30 [Nanoarchaeota archaeon]